MSLTTTLPTMSPTLPSTTTSPTPPKETTPIPLVSYGGNPPVRAFPLGRCEGDCDINSDCSEGLVCFQRGYGGVDVPGCFGGKNDLSRTDYCVLDPNASPTPPTSAPHQALTRNPTTSPTKAPMSLVHPPSIHELPILVSHGGNPPPQAFPLGLCHGDCDVNDDVSTVIVVSLLRLIEI